MSEVAAEVLTTPDPSPLILPFVSMRQLLEEPVPDTPWIVDRLLPAGGTSLLCSLAKSGKSTLVRSLILSVSRGLPFLGRTTVAGPVGYLCLEDQRGMVATAFRKLGATADDPIFVLFDRPKTSSEALDGLRDFIRTHSPVLVVVDMLSKFAPISDFNNYADVNAGMAAIQSVVRDFPQTHTMFLHHSTKDVERSKYSGSVALHGNVDVLVHIHGTGNGRRVVAAERQRYEADLPKTQLQMDETTGAVTGIEFESSHSTPPPKRRLDIEIIKALGDIDRPLTTKELLGLVKARRSAVLEALGSLVVSGAVVKNSWGGYQLCSATQLGSVPGSPPYRGREPGTSPEPSEDATSPS